MKTVLLNGSPRKNGNTFTALEIVATILRKQGIQTEILQIGNEIIRGCIACNGCGRNGDEKCIIQDDIVNDYVQKMKEAEGIIIGSPVHFSGIGATLKAFLDRAFFVSTCNGNLFRHKVGASVVAVRRSGGLTTFNELNHYLLYSEMMVASSNYWNVIHGLQPGEATQDAEGVQILEVLANNFAYMLKLQEAGKGITPPKSVEKTFTNFIR